MSDATGEPVPPFHLLLDAEQVPMAAHALRLLISDEAHEPDIRRLAREVIDGLDRPADERGVVSVELAPQQMKIAHTAVRLLLNDLQREQEPERVLLRAILDKLPDEHVMRAIQLD
jgi:hypothetical protein